MCIDTGDCDGREQGVERDVRFGTILMRIIMLTESRAMIMGSQSVLFKSGDYGTISTETERVEENTRERERERERQTFLLLP